MTAALSQWVVYERPSDFPGYVVVRRWEITPGHAEPTSEIWICADVAAARQVIAREAPGAVRLNRHPSDDAVIVEVWT